MIYKVNITSQQLFFFCLLILGIAYSAEKLASPNLYKGYGFMEFLTVQGLCITFKLTFT